MEVMGALERIMNTPIVELTAVEIAMLTPEQQRWVWAYRSEQRQKAEEKRNSAARKDGDDTQNAKDEVPY